MYEAMGADLVVGLSLLRDPSLCCVLRVTYKHCSVHLFVYMHASLLLHWIAFVVSLVLALWTLDQCQKFDHGLSFAVLLWPSQGQVVCER